MSEHLKRIESFVDAHHVLSLATSNGEELSACNLFYAYEKKLQTFIVASSDNTTHIQNILKNNNIAGTIVLETKAIGQIKGLQFRGIFSRLEDKKRSHLYFKAFPTALAMRPTLWKIEIKYFKFTDNTLGFGKKIIWES